MINGVEVLTSEMVKVSADFEALIFTGILLIGFALIVFYCFGYCVKNKIG